MIRWLVSTVASMACLVLPAIAQTGYAPPEVGSVLRTTTLDESGPSTYSALVVAAGEDFILTRDLDEAVDEPTAYYAEFAGLLLMYCEEDLPSVADRAALMSLWPLKAGADVELQFVPGARVSILAEREGRLPTGETAPGHVAVVDYGGDDSFEENLLMLEGLSTPTMITSSGRSATTLTAIESAAPTVEISLPDDTTLQNCASLF